MTQASFSRRAVIAGTAAALFTPSIVRAAGLRVSVAEFPDPVSTPAIVAALKIALGKVAGAGLEIRTAPFARSMAAVGSGAADLHVPMLRPPHEDGLDWAVTTATVYHVPFVLYMNKDKPLDLGSLGKSRIETEVAHVGYFDFPVVGSAGIESSLQKVAAGRIDGYVFAGNIIDPIIQKLGITNLRRAFYKTFDAAGVLPKGGKGGPVDTMVSQAMAAVAGDAAFAAEIAKVLSGYRGPDWQV